MKRILNYKLVICCLLLSLSNAASAMKLWESLHFQPYLGWEYQYEHIKPAQAYRNILSTDVQTGNLFVGTKLNHVFGVEVGWYTSLKTAQQQFQPFTFNGEQASAQTALLTRTSFKGFSIDGALYYRLDYDFNVSIIAGAATVHPTISFQAQEGSDLASAFVLITPRNRIVPRVGLGLELMKQHWGLRSRIFWVYTQNMKLNVTAAQKIFPAIANQPYVQAIQATVGLFYRF